MGADSRRTVLPEGVPYEIHVASGEWGVKDTTALTRSYKMYGPISNNATLFTRELCMGGGYPGM